MKPGVLPTILIIGFAVAMSLAAIAWYNYRKRRRIEAEEAAELEKQAFDRANPPRIYGDPAKHEQARIGLDRLEANLNDI